MTPLAMVWVHTHPLTARGRAARNIPSSARASGRAIDHGDARVRPRARRAASGWTGERYSMADIVLLTTIDFAKFIGVEMPDETAALQAWHERVSARPSAQA